MIKKSRFLTFLLSFVPGLGHIYLGLYIRGAAFLLAEFLVALLIGILAGVMNIGSAQFIGFLIPLIWLVSMVDALTLVSRINAGHFQQEGSSLALQDNIMGFQNKKAIAMMLSIIPGAGHMYLDLQLQGVQLMGAFFLCIFLTDWLQLGLFMVFVPIIWFFGMFDAMHKASSEEVPEDKSILPAAWLKDNGLWIKNKGRFLGYTLIVVGCYLLFERIILPEISIQWDLQFGQSLQTGIVALLLILGGIKLIMGNKKEKIDEKGDL